MAKKKYYSTTKSYNKFKHPYIIYRTCRFLAGLSLRRHKIIYEHGEPDNPAVFLCNHERSYGPIVMMTKFKRKVRPWTIALLCFWKTAWTFLYSDCFPAKTKIGRFFSKLASYILTPVSVGIFNGAESIPVFYDSRVSMTFKKSLASLKEKVDMVIFPEPSRHYLEYDQHFSIGFVNIARQYYKETKEKLKFYPVYACKKKSIIVVGKPAEFNPDLPFTEERNRIGEYILRMMMDMALFHEEGRTLGLYEPTLSAEI